MTDMIFTLFYLATFSILSCLERDVKLSACRSCASHTWVSGGICRTTGHCHRVIYWRILVGYIHKSVLHVAHHIHWHNVGMYQWWWIWKGIVSCNLALHSWNTIGVVDRFPLWHFPWGVRSSWWVLENMMLSIIRYLVSDIGGFFCSVRYIISNIFVCDVWMRILCFECMWPRKQ